MRSSSPKSSNIVAHEVTGYQEGVTKSSTNSVKAFFVFVEKNKIKFRIYGLLANASTLAKKLTCQYFTSKRHEIKMILFWLPHNLSITKNGIFYNDSVLGCYSN